MQSRSTIAHHSCVFDRELVGEVAGGGGLSALRPLLAPKLFCTCSDRISMCAHRWMSFMGLATLVDSHLAVIMLQTQRVGARPPKSIGLRSCLGVVSRRSAGSHPSAVMFESRARRSSHHELCGARSASCGAARL